MLCNQRTRGRLSDIVLRYVCTCSHSCLNVGLCRAEPSRAGPGRAEPRRAEPSQRILSCNCTLQRASRLRETPDFKTRHSSTSFSSTRNTHFQNQVSSRLHETLLFLNKCCLVYAKPQLCEATLSRAHPSPALLSQLEHGKSRVSCTQNACLQNT